MRLLRSSRFACYPFWVLIVAWLCANTPQVALWHAILWVKQAQHFSHSSQLRSEVYALLSGQPIDHSSRYGAQPVESETPSKPAVAADFSVKKILLSLEATSPVTPSLLVPQRWSEGGVGTMAEHVADVPYPPPRA
ncbi:MAG TPA: hypothetical protein VIO38_16590 [Rariglobus sp.]